MSSGVAPSQSSFPHGVIAFGFAGVALVMLFPRWHEKRLWQQPIQPYGTAERTAEVAYGRQFLFKPPESSVRENVRYEYRVNLQGMILEVLAVAAVAAAIITIVYADRKFNSPRT